MRVFVFVVECPFVEAQYAIGNLDIGKFSVTGEGHLRDIALVLSDKHHIGINRLNVSVVTARQHSCDQTVRFVVIDQTDVVPVRAATGNKCFGRGRRALEVLNDSGGISPSSHQLNLSIRFSFDIRLINPVLVIGEDNGGLNYFTFIGYLTVSTCQYQEVIIALCRIKVSTSNRIGVLIPHEAYVCAS